MLQPDKKKRPKWKLKFLRHNTIENAEVLESQVILGASLNVLFTTHKEQSMTPSTLKSQGSSSDYDSIFTGRYLQISNGSFTSPVAEYLPRSFPTGNAELYRASLSLQSVTGNTNRGPKVKPYIFTQTHQPNFQRISNINETKCFICDELLQTKLQHERIIELKCGDFIHGECFEVSVKCGIERLTKIENFKLTSRNIEQAFPICKGNKCKTVQRKILPTDEHLIDHLFTSVLLDQKDKTLHLRNSNLAILNSTLKSQRAQEFQDNNIAALHNSKSLGLPLMSQLPIPYSALCRYSANIDRGSLSPSPNSSISTVNTLRIKIPVHKNIPINLLKSEFIGYLINNCMDFNLTTLLKLGELRLLDKLLVSHDGHNFASKIAYLFENYLIEWSLNSTDVTLFPTKNMKISTVNSSILKLYSSHSEVSTIWLNSEISLIIEKWVIATSDPNFKFPNDIITSTIIIPTLGGREEFCNPETPTQDNNSNEYLCNKNSDSTINLIPDVTKDLKGSSNDYLMRMNSRALSLNNTKIDLLFKSCTSTEKLDDPTGEDNSDDSDVDSDQDLIDRLTTNTESGSKLTTLNDLLNTIDNALIESRS